MEKINRRTILAAIPACGLAPIVPAEAVAVEPETPRDRILRHWQELVAAINDYHTMPGDGDWNLMGWRDPNGKTDVRLFLRSRDTPTGPDASIDYRVEIEL